MPNSIGYNAKYPAITQSEALYARAQEIIPCATQTLAKGPSQFVRGVAPIYLARGEGARVWDVDENEYLDFCMAVGPLSLGYTYPEVDNAIRAQLARGITFSLMHPLELEVAEKIRAAVPNAEMIRFSKSGADVTSAAIRLARAYTGRKKILCCGYHGWHDWYIGVTSRAAGIPEEIRSLSQTFPYNDLASLEAALDHDTAAVILEPVLFEAPQKHFLPELRKLCTERGALLIFDEMWTGFRIALGGAQEHFDVRADLVTYSKAIANGMPLSVLAGRKEVMKALETDVFFFTTFGGETLSLAAASATLDVMRSKNVSGHLWALGERLQSGYNAIADRLDMHYTRCQGLPFRTLVSFAASAGDPLEMKSYVQQELIRRGILWSGTHTLSLSHTESDVEYLLSAYEEVLPMLKKIVESGQIRACLKGAPVEPVFRTTTGTPPVRRNS